MASLPQLFGFGKSDFAKNRFCGMITPITTIKGGHMSLIAGNLGAVQRLLDGAGMSWGVCAGAAAYAYGVRRPIANVDILLPPGHLREVRTLLEKNQRTAQYDGKILLWRGIKLFDNLPVSIDNTKYPFVMDEAMQTHLRRLFLLGSKVFVLAPEDVLAQKAMLTLQNSDSAEHHHRQDMEALIRFQGKKMDPEYLLQRLHLCQVETLARPLLKEVGVPLPD
jgi:hypothetical protein